MGEPVHLNALRDAYSAAYGPARKAWLNDSDAHDKGLEAVARIAANELDRLRAVIENAPHECTCQWPYGDDDPEAYGNYCDCWKADAL